LGRCRGADGTDRISAPARLGWLFMLLAFDTSSSAVTVALHDGEGVIAESTVVDPLRHGELLAPGISRVLADAAVGPGDLTRIAVGVGPGPYTGLRVGIVTARIMGFALKVPVVGVCTLDVVATAVRSEGAPFMVAMDARRKEVYWARYDAYAHRLSEPAVGRPEAVASEEPVAGRGPLLYPDWFPSAVPPEYPSAADLARLVMSGHAAELPPEPLYLRRPDVAQPSARKRVS
jgi:tRNA threonylcarbamoyladenosine biosynthesis protein TsaB